MFGLKDTRQIYHEALFQLALKNNIGGKIGEIANNILDGASKIWDKVIGENYSQADKMERTGVAVVAKEKGLRCGITLRNLKIHDVHGNVYDKHMNNGGIYMTALQPAEEVRKGEG